MTSRKTRRQKARNGRQSKPDQSRKRPRAKDIKGMVARGRRLERSLLLSMREEWGFCMSEAQALRYYRSSPSRSK